MKKRTVIIVAVVVLAIAGSVFGIVKARNANQSDSAELLTYQIAYGGLSAVVDETGEVHADQSAFLYWKSSGIVGEVKVGIGERVSQGQVLAEITEESLPQNYFLSQQELITANRALEDLYQNAAEVAANAQLAVANARDALDRAQHQFSINQPGNRFSDEELSAAKARLLLAEEHLEDMQTKYNNTGSGVVRAQIQLVLTDAINQYQQAQWYVNWLQVGADDIEMAILDANVAAALANLDNAERLYEQVKDGPTPEDIRMVEARIAGAQAALDSAVITAPFDGVITAVDVIEGDLVSPNTLAFRIDNLDTLLVDVGISEVDINQISVGQPVKLAFDAILGKEYQGEVVKVSPVGVLQQGLVSFQVTIRVTDADEDVRPGLTAAVQIVVRQVEEALLIPNRAVRWAKGEQVVYLSPDGKNALIENLVRVPVTLGASSDEYTELLEGEIQEGNYLVLNPPSVNIFDAMESGHSGPPGMR